jgi:hypothetical protein
MSTPAVHFRGVNVQKPNENKKHNELQMNRDILGRQIYRQSHRQTYRQTDNYRGRHVDRQAEQKMR